MGKFGFKNRKIQAGVMGTRFFVISEKQAKMAKYRQE
jgi:hypothetical protein